MKMFVAGAWRAGKSVQNVRNVWTGEVLDSVPVADSTDIEDALEAGAEAAKAMRKLPAWDRSRIICRAADLVQERRADLALLITREEGKTISESLAEVSRAVETLRWSGEEAKRLFGETLPLDGAPGGSGKFGFAERVPCGLVVAIAPFNFPLNLVCHKIGPALAAGNSVILKPASATPLTALRLTEIMLEAGLPALALQCVTGKGGELGTALCGDRRVRKITFTGSFEVGQAICRVAGVKKVTMELGSNAPLIVLDDADLDLAVAATVATGYANAGQVCISTQRVILHQAIADEYTSKLTARVAALKLGNPELPETTLSPMISSFEAERVASWISEAVAGGARLLVGAGVGTSSAASLSPEILVGVSPSMRVWRDELFGPVVCLKTVGSFAEAMEKANDSRFGLSAALFTRNVDRALTAARELDAGNVHINWGPGWRADLMPYGGVKDSGVGREGPRYAAHEMTELKSVIMHMSPTGQML